MTMRRSEVAERVSENWDTVFRSLSAEPRRQLVVSLLDAPPEGSVPLPESAAMSALQSDPETLRTELYHVHLPILAENGFIRWETDPLVAFRGPKFDRVAVVFDALHSAASEMPDSLVVGCRRLERENRGELGVS